jgi:hypothetical protein
MHSQHTGFEAPTKTVSQRTWLEEKRKCLAVERLELENQVGKEQDASVEESPMPSFPRINYLLQDSFGTSIMSARQYRMEGKWLEAMRVRSLATTNRDIRFKKVVKFIRYVDRITSHAK